METNERVLPVVGTHQVVTVAVPANTHAWAQAYRTAKSATSALAKAASFARADHAVIEVPAVDGTRTYWVIASESLAAELATA